MKHEDNASKRLRSPEFARCPYVENAPIGDVPLTLEAVKAFAEKCLKAEPPQVIIPYFAKRSK